jgi:hypothetical protein
MTTIAHSLAELFANTELAEAAIALEENNINQIKNQYLNEIAKGKQVQEFQEDCQQEYGEKEGQKKYRQWLKMHGANSAHERGMKRALNVYQFHIQLSKELQEKFVSLAHSWSAHTLNTLGKSNPRQANALVYLIEKHLTNTESNELPERILQKLIDSVENYTKNDCDVRKEDWLRLQGFEGLESSEIERLKEEAENNYMEIDSHTGDRILTTNSLKILLQQEGYETKYIFAPPKVETVRKSKYHKLEAEKAELERKLTTEQEEAQRLLAEAQRQHALEIERERLEKRAIAQELDRTRAEQEKAYQSPAAEQSSRGEVMKKLDEKLVGNTNYPHYDGQTFNTELIKGIPGDASYRVLVEERSNELLPTLFNEKSSTLASVVSSSIIGTKKTDDIKRPSSLSFNAKASVGNLANRHKTKKGFGK